MKTYLWTILMTLILGVVAAPAIAANPQDFTVTAVDDDSTFTLSEARGKVVALHFLLKTECPYCIRYTHEYHAKRAETPIVVHVFLKPDTEAEIAAWATKLEGDRPKIYRDPEAKLAKQFGIPGSYKFHGEVVHYPAVVLLDENGKEFFRYVGKSNSDRLPHAEFVQKVQTKR